MGQKKACPRCGALFIKEKAFKIHYRRMHSGPAKFQVPVEYRGRKGGK